MNNQLVLQEEQLLESKSHLSDLEYELEKSRSKEAKLERSLADAIAKLERSLADAIAKLERDRLKLQANDIKQDPDSDQNNSNNNTVVIAENKYADLQAEIEEFKDLAAGRLIELEKLISDHETTKREVELLKIKVIKIFNLIFILKIRFFSFVLYQKNLLMKHRNLNVFNHVIQL